MTHYYQVVKIKPPKKHKEVKKMDISIHDVIKVTKRTKDLTRDNGEKFSVTEYMIYTKDGEKHEVSLFHSTTTLI